MKIKKYKTKEVIEVQNPRELKEILKWCNPTIVKYYQSQLPSLEIKGFGKSIEIIRKQV